MGRVEGHDGDAARQPIIRAIQKRGRALGQIAQQIIKKGTQFGGRDIAHRRDINAVARKDLRVGVEHVLTCQRGDTLGRAGPVGPVGMIAPDHAVKLLPRNGGGVGRITAQPRQDLPTHTVKRLLIKGGFNQRGLQKRHGGVAVFSEHLRRNRQHIVEHTVAEPGGELFCGLRKAACVQITCALFQKAGHQVDGPAFAGQIQRRAAAKADFKGHEGNGVFLHEPGVDATLGRDFLHLDRGQRLERKQGQKKGDDELETGHDHSPCAAGCVR